jgi:hypothetical protein
MISSRFATKKDFDFFFGNEQLPHSAKAWVLKEGRKKYAIGGVWLMPKQFTSFVRVRKNLPKKEFWKISKLVTEELRRLEFPVICFRDEKRINSKRYLEKLGYKYFNTINNQEIYKLWPK